MIQKLKIATPETYLVNQYLVEIAKAYNVNWSNEESAPKYESHVPLPIGYPPDIKSLKEYASITPQSFNETAVQPQQSAESAFPTIPATTSEKTQSFDPDFDELEKRFEALKKKK